ncbi:hypothetical protein ABB37_00040 [Leptomonas pyrrhocoris]|uniref:N-acetyltransferase domain-containing protein n=1 Tax=Leptomonas pyrrhocoris TaxID=157538 RepID=A0A0M9G9U5_LEPPY|nr:hypothetical protein ABB37_00040 [Leptomonas pyrrhocoris]KPA85639.1 hypothetical protein ABB37_00040 [Leptomonas pyrrhocoris]|eukprot:XP_015664078.1 hypothetical protein ABB37_00040 [Leptomonas pyrrhocoris]
MPPKTTNKKSNKAVARRDHFDEAAIDALVKAIEGKAKKGTTKVQRKQKDSKSIMTATEAQNHMLAEQMRNAFLAQMKEQAAMPDPTYINVPVPLTEEQKNWQEVAPNKYIRYEQFQGSDEEMNFIVKLFTEELTEPYSSFTYQYFVFGWPDLCITAYGVESEAKPEASVTGEKVGAVVSRVTRKRAGMPLRGYVAMFAVVPAFRGFRLGSRLVSLTVELMRKKDCDEVYLETPTSNDRALGLYLNLGFVKTKFLPRYYLDHSDAVRLKLWLKDAVPKSVAEDMKEEAQEKEE